ncbi:hypothetical protein [Ralstonia solanacearum]|uniref:hypothetical protein n=1 Tax=Ralstonia solanacearum TaxID=305 RepID=UPI0012D33C88|nr:hypothetical protein [Ralstonia solanacearum]
MMKNSAQINMPLAPSKLRMKNGNLRKKKNTLNSIMRASTNILPALGDHALNAESPPTGSTGHAHGTSTDTHRPTPWISLQPIDIKGFFLPTESTDATLRNPAPNHASRPEHQDWWGDTGTSIPRHHHPVTK